MGTGDHSTEGPGTADQGPRQLAGLILALGSAVSRIATHSIEVPFGVMYVTCSNHRWSLCACCLAPPRRMSTAPPRNPRVSSRPRPVRPCLSVSASRTHAPPNCSRAWAVPATQWSRSRTPTRSRPSTARVLPCSTASTSPKPSAPFTRPAVLTKVRQCRTGASPCRPTPTSTATPPPAVIAWPIARHRLRWTTPRHARTISPPRTGSAHSNCSARSTTPTPSWPCIRPRMAGCSWTRRATNVMPRP